MPQQTDIAYSFMIRRTRETAGKLLERLEALYAQYPSDSLLKAVHEVREWKDSLEGEDFPQP